MVHFLSQKAGAQSDFESGLGIAYVAALRAKVPVLLHDRSEAQLKKGLAFMDKLLDKDVSKVRTRGRTFISD